MPSANAYAMSNDDPQAPTSVTPPIKRVTSVAQPGAGRSIKQLHQAQASINHVTPPCVVAECPDPEIPALKVADPSLEEQRTMDSLCTAPAVNCVGCARTRTWPVLGYALAPRPYLLQSLCEGQAMPRPSQRALAEATRERVAAQTRPISGPLCTEHACPAPQGA